MKYCKLSALALAACLSAFALPASAEWIDVYHSTEVTKGALGQRWTGAWLDSWNVAEAPTDIVIEDDTLSYHYLGGNFWYGTMTQTYLFSTTADEAGSLSLGIDLVSNAQWDGSATSMYIWQGNIANRTLLAGATAGEVEHVDTTLNLLANQQWGFMAVSGSVGDRTGFTGPVFGAFTVNRAATPAVPDAGEVPEPASLALLGLGAFGLAAARRRKG